LDLPAPLPQSRPEGFLYRHGVKLFVSLLMGGSLALLLVRGGLPLVPRQGAFDSLIAWTVPAYIASLVVVHLFRAIRWRHLLEPIGHVPAARVLAVSWIGFAAIMISVFRSGEVVRPLLISRRGPVRLWEAAGTIGAERVIDGLLLSLILFISLQLSTPLDPLPDRIGDLPVPAAAVPGAAYTVLAIFAAAFAMMALFFWRRDLARRIIHALVDPISRKLADRAAGIVEGVAGGLSFLPSPRHLAPFLVETLIYWGVNALGVWLLAWGCGLTSISFAEACVIMGCVGIGILVPAGPGYFGAFQLSTYMALAMFFPEGAIKGAGAAFVFLIYTTQLGWHVVAAGIGVLLDPETKLLGVRADAGADAGGSSDAGAGAGK
jgi:hypothetical protein